MYQRPKSSDCLVISVGRSGMSVSAMKTPKAQLPTSKPRFVAALGVGSWRLGVVGAPSGANKHVRNVLPPFYVVAIGKVRAKVAAAALLPAQRRARDEQPDGDNAPDAAEIAFADASLWCMADERMPRLEPRDRGVEAVRVAQHPAVAPHQRTDIVRCGQFDARRALCAGWPRHHLVVVKRRGSRRPDHRVGGAPSEDEPFEQRVA